MNKNKLTILGVLLAMVLLITMSFSTADPLVVGLNTSFTTTEERPEIWFNYTDATNATASCVLFMDDVARATNATTLNNTLSFLRPTTTPGFAVWTTYVNCTTNPSTDESNVTASLDVSIAMMECSGVEATISGFLLSLFMIGMIGVLAYLGFKSGDSRFLIGAVIGLIVWVIGIGIINPVIAGLCG